MCSSNYNQTSREINQTNRQEKQKSSNKIKIKSVRLLNSYKWIYQYPNFSSLSQYLFKRYCQEQDNRMRLITKKNS